MDTRQVSFDWIVCLLTHRIGVLRSVLAYTVLEMDGLILHMYTAVVLA